MERFARAGAVAGTIGGVLLAGSAIVYVANHDIGNFAHTVTVGSFRIAAAVGLVTSVLLAWGLLAVYVRQADRGGTLSLVGAILTLGAMMLLTAYYFTDLFVAPVLAEVAPDILNGTGDSGSIGLGMLLVWAVPNLALVIFGIATLRSRTLPTWGAAALLVAGPVNLIPVDGTQIVTALALAAASFAAARPTPQPATGTVPATA